VDEFQDTSDLQVELLSRIAKEGRTRLFLVGDLCQSIFRFAGARPDLADSLARDIGARCDLHLSGNFRSSRPIVDHANCLFPRQPLMVPVGPFAGSRVDPEWQHGRSVFEVITDSFLPALDALGIPLGEAAILAPTWFPLFPLGRRLREYGVSIVGPGARPYRRNRQFAPLAEQVCGYIIEPRSELIASIERTLFNTLLDLTGASRFDIFSYSGRKTVFELLACARALGKTYTGAIAWLEAAASSFSKILVEEGYLTSTQAVNLVGSIEEMKGDMRRNKVDTANLTLADLGVYASPDSALKLSTLHNAKGHEYRGVAMIDMHEGKIPFYQARDAEDIAEAKRLFYVGVTRAKQYLLYVTDSSHSSNRASRFLRGEVGVGIVP
jgi:DNA helicase II / ATP-dependent DNA helicase PcrA